MKVPSMKLPHRRSTIAALLGAASAAAGQGGSVSTPQGRAASQEDAKLPDGTSQRDKILEAERDRNLKDAADLVDLTQQLQQDIEKNGAFVFSLNTMKKMDDIEKLVKKIRSRMRHN
jgi:predicted phage gp36 major capsid-like protein